MPRNAPWPVHAGYNSCIYFLPNDKDKLLTPWHSRNPFSAPAWKWKTPAPRPLRPLHCWYIDWQRVPSARKTAYTKEYKPYHHPWPDVLKVSLARSALILVITWLKKQITINNPSFIATKIKGNNLFFLKTNILFLSLIEILLTQNVTNHFYWFSSRFITINKRTFYYIITPIPPTNFYQTIRYNV